MFKRGGNKRRELGLGSLTTVALADAREKARALRNTIAEGQIGVDSLAQPILPKSGAVALSCTNNRQAPSA